MSMSKILKKWPWELFASNLVWGYNEVDREPYIRDWLDHEYKVTVSHNKGEGFNDWKKNENLIENAHRLYDILAELSEAENLTKEQKSQITQLLKAVNGK